MGRGEYSAAFANMRALTVTVGPLIFGNVYAYSKQSGLGGGIPWYLAGLIGCVVPLLLHESVSDQAIADGLAPTDSNKQ